MAVVGLPIQIPNTGNIVNLLKKNFEVLQVFRNADQLPAAGRRAASKDYLFKFPLYM